MKASFLLAAILSVIFLENSFPAGELVSFPGVTIDRKKCEVRVAAAVSEGLSWQSSILEFILISDANRNYESAFVTKADPAHIHLGLMLIGLAPGELAEPAEPASNRQGPALPPPQEKTKKPASPVAPLVDLLVEWAAENGQIKSERVEKLLVKRSTGVPSPALAFAFTGSYLINNEQGQNVLAATQSGAVVALLYDNSAVLNLPFYEGSPYNETEKFGYMIRPQELPACFLTTTQVMVTPEKEESVKIPYAYPVTIIFKPSNLKTVKP